ncbi:MAG: conjugal transfer protein TraF, partial [bacterium]|nr:conjugal transfer protein TraF [bacterium]
YKNFTDTLSGVLDSDLNNFESLASDEKEAVFSQLQELFTSKTGLYGFSGNVPGFATRSYGISVSFVNTAIMNPVKPDAAGGFFDRDPETVSNADIASLEMNIVGLKYKQISLAYAMPLSRGLNLGVGFHYLNGKVTEYNASITGDTFSRNFDSKNYLEQAWDAADEKFSKIITDLSVSMDIGHYFRAALVAKNVGSPKIKTSVRDITLKQRLIAGLALRPNPQWGIYLDMDIA